MHSKMLINKSSIFLSGKVESKLFALPNIPYTKNEFVLLFFYIVTSLNSTIKLNFLFRPLSPGCRWHAQGGRLSENRFYHPAFYLVKLL